MRTRKTDSLLLRIILLSVFSAPFGNVWASGSCLYAQSGAGIGGTGIVGSGIGGTGAIAEGTGIGGTGITPDAQLAGKVILSQGTAEARSNGRSRPLAKGDAVCVGETIATSVSGIVQIRMTDDGLLAVRPETQLKIEKYAYNGTVEDTSVLALHKGACRIITGNIGKLRPQNDLVETPSATIGVRGTDHEVTVVLPGGSGGYPPGTYDKVNQGITFIRSERGEIDIRPSQVGFAPSAGESPTILKDMPVFYIANSLIGQDIRLLEESGKEEGLEGNKFPGSHNDRGPSGTPERELSHNLKLHELPHSQGLPDLSHHPEVPEVPELPETPELPELPDVPEPLEPPDVPEPPHV